MIATQPRLWRVMISSTMLDMQETRQAIAQTITDAGMEPLYADRRPNEYTESNEQLSYGMAEQCDLYLLIIKDRYGTLDANTGRSITHEEFLIAKKTPRKVRVFIHRDAKAMAETYHEVKLFAFLDEVMDFKTGISWTEYTDQTSLLAEIKHTITTFRDGGQGARLAYARWVVEILGEFKNPVTGVTSSYDATVMLKLRTEEQRRERPRMEIQAEEERREQDKGAKQQYESRRERRDSEQHVLADVAKPFIGLAGEFLEKSEQHILMEVAKPIIALAVEFLEKYERLVVIGEVGAGKSTLLRRIAYDAARAYLTDPLQTRLPVIIRSADLGRMARHQTNRSLADVAGMIKEHEVQDPAIRQQIRYAVGEAMEQGNALLLVDSLDEASEIDQRAVLASLSSVGRNWALLASRPSTSPSSLSGWRICDIQRLDVSQRRELITNVLQAVLPEDTEIPDPALLEKTLQQRQSDLFDWAGNPLLLTLITTQFARDRKLPESRAHIYEAAIEDLQHQRDAIGDRRISLPKLNELLSHLALAMTKEVARSTIVEEVATKYLKDDIKRLYPDVPSEKIAQELLDRSGVLGKELDRYEWIHLSFREYLTALALSSYAEAALQGVIHQYCLNGQWEQVWQLLVSIYDTDAQPQKADQVIKALITLDPISIHALKQHDPLHIALSIATRCYFSQPEHQRNSVIAKTLQQRWQRLIRIESRKQLAGAEMFVAAITIDVTSPIYLTEGLPFIIDTPFFRKSDEGFGYVVLIIGFLLIAVILLITSFALATLLIPPLVGSGWGKLVNGWAPISILTSLGVLLLARIIGSNYWRASSQRAWLKQLLPQLKTTNISLSGIEKLVQVLGNSDVRLASARALGQLGERIPFTILERLVKSLESYDSEVSTEGAAQALGQLGERVPTIGIEALVKTVEDPLSIARAAAIQALGQMGERVPTIGIEALVQALEDPNSDVKAAAAQALGQMGERVPTTGIEALVKAVEDPLSIVGVAAAQSLGRLGERVPTTGIEALVKVLGNYSVREVAAQALGQLGEQVPFSIIEGLVKALRNSDYSMREGATQALGQLGEYLPSTIIEGLVQSLSSSDYYEQLAAAEILGQIGKRIPSSGIETLVKALSSPLSAMRVATAQALGQLGESVPLSGIEGLVKALSDSDPNMRQAAAQALGQLGESVPLSGIEGLIKALSDSSVNVRQAVAQALGQQRERIPLSRIETLVKALRDSDANVRRSITQVLTQLQQYISISQLMSITRFYRKTVGTLLEESLTFLQYLTDLPIILLVLFIQVSIIWSHAIILPAPLRIFITTWSGWPQAVLLLTGYGVIYIATRSIRSSIVQNRVKQQNNMYDLLTGVLRGQLKGTDHKLR